MTVTGTEQRVYGTLIGNCYVDLRRFALVVGDGSLSPPEASTVIYASDSRVKKLDDYSWLRYGYSDEKPIGATRTPIRTYTGFSFPISDYIPISHSYHIIFIRKDRGINKLEVSSTPYPSAAPWDWEEIIHFWVNTVLDINKEPNWIKLPWDSSENIGTYYLEFEFKGDDNSSYLIPNCPSAPFFNISPRVQVGTESGRIRLMLLVQLPEYGQISIPSEFDPDWVFYNDYPNVRALIWPEPPHYPLSSCAGKIGKYSNGSFIYNNFLSREVESVTVDDSSPYIFIDRVDNIHGTLEASAFWYVDYSQTPIFTHSYPTLIKLEWYCEKDGLHINLIKPETNIGPFNVFSLVAYEHYDGTYTTINEGDNVIKINVLGDSHTPVTWGMPLGKPTTRYGIYFELLDFGINSNPNTALFTFNLKNFNERYQTITNVPLTFDIHTGDTFYDKITFNISSINKKNNYIGEIDTESISIQYDDEYIEEYKKTNISTPNSNDESVTITIDDLLTNYRNPPAQDGNPYAGPYYEFNFGNLWKKITYSFTFKTTLYYKETPDSEWTTDLPFSTDSGGWRILLIIGNRNQLLNPLNRPRYENYYGYGHLLYDSEIVSTDPFTITYKEIPMTKNFIHRPYKVLERPEYTTLSHIQSFNRYAVPHKIYGLFNWKIPAQYRNPESSIKIVIEVMDKEFKHLDGTDVESGYKHIPIIGTYNIMSYRLTTPFPQP